MLRIEQELERQRMSQARLARRAEIDQATVSRLVRGQLFCYAGWRRRLGRVLGVPGDELFKPAPDERAE